MNVDFIIMNQEVGIKFEVSLDFFYYFREKLNTVAETIKHYDKLWKGQNYTLLFTLGATTKDIKLFWGTTVSPKNKEVYFSIFIPFKHFIDHKAEEVYILSYIEEAFKQLCKKYKMNFYAYQIVFEEMIEVTQIGKIPKRKDN